MMIRFTLYCCAQIFEKWRAVDHTALQGDKQAEYKRDKAESNRRYDTAFEVVLSRTSPVELSDFIALFNDQTNGQDEIIGEPTFTTSNPMLDKVGFGFENPMLDSLDEGAVSTSTGQADAEKSSVSRNKSDDNGILEEMMI
jgi:hypothetical protein